MYCLHNLISSVERFVYFVLIDTFSGSIDKFTNRESNPLARVCGVDKWLPNFVCTYFGVNLCELFDKQIFNDPVTNAESNNTIAYMNDIIDKYNELT